EGGFDLRGRQTGTGDIHDIVDASEEPDVAVGITTGTVSCEVRVREPRRVGVLEALGVFPDPGQHRRPRLADDEESAFGAGRVRAGIVDDVYRDAGDRRLGRAGL